MAAVPSAEIIGTADIEMHTVLGEQVNALFRHARWEFAVAAGRHREQITELRRQTLDDSGKLWVQYTPLDQPGSTERALQRGNNSDRARARSMPGTDRGRTFIMSDSRQLSDMEFGNLSERMQTLLA